MHFKAEEMSRLCAAHPKGLTLIFRRLSTLMTGLQTKYADLTHRRGAGVWGQSPHLKNHPNAS
jgi:hypothetical protein